LIKISKSVSNDYNEIVKLAFKDELIKLGVYGPILARLAKMAPKLTESLYKTKTFYKGIPGAVKTKNLKHFTQYQRPNVIMGKTPKLSKSIYGKAKVKTPFGAQIMADVAANIGYLGKGLSKQKGIISKSEQLSKNIVGWTASHLRGSQYKTLNSKKWDIAPTPGKTGLWAKRKKFPLSGKLPARQVFKNEAGQLMVKKRSYIRPLATAGTVPGFMGISGLMGRSEAKQKGKSSTVGTLKGLGRGALWMSPAIGGAHMLSEFK